MYVECCTNENWIQIIVDPIDDTLIICNLPVEVTVSIPRVWVWVIAAEIETGFGDPENTKQRTY